MREIIYSRINYYRKKEYRIVTKILKDGDKLIVRKEAENSTSIPHIQSMIEKYDLINSHKDLNPAKIINKGDNFLEFEFIDSPTFEIQIENALMQKDFNIANNLIIKFNNIVDNMTSVKSNLYSEDLFSSIFDPEKTFADNTERESIKPANFDLNMDNILMNNDKICILDYEWVIDIPVEKNFIKFRSIYAISNKLQSIIRQSLNEENKGVQVTKDVVIPIEWLKIIGLDFNEDRENIKRYMVYETNFLNYVYYIKNIFSSQIIDSSNIISESMSNNVEDIFQNLNSSENELKYVKSQLKDTLQENESNKQLINHYRRTKAWFAFRLFYKAEITLKKLLRRN